MYSYIEHVDILPIITKGKFVKFKIILQPNQYIVRIHLNTTKRCFSQTVTGDNNKLSLTRQDFLDMSYQLFNPSQKLDMYERMIGKISETEISKGTVFLYPVRLTAGDDMETREYFELWSQKYKEFTFDIILTENVETNDRFKLWVEFGYSN